MLLSKLSRMVEAPMIPPHLVYQWQSIEYAFPKCQMISHCTTNDVIGVDKLQDIHGEAALPSTVCMVLSIIGPVAEEGVLPSLRNQSNWSRWDWVKELRPLSNVINPARHTVRLRVVKKEEKSWSTNNMWIQELQRERGFRVAPKKREIPGFVS